MGSSSNLLGQAGKFANTVINPMQWWRLSGSTKKYADWDFLGNAGLQAQDNTRDFFNGKSNFINHENWFGRGKINNWANTVMGVRDEKGRAAEAASQKAWLDYYTKNKDENGNYVPISTTPQSKPTSGGNMVNTTIRPGVQDPKPFMTANHLETISSQNKVPNSDQMYKSETAQKYKEDSTYNSLIG